MLMTPGSGEKTIFPGYPYTATATMTRDDDTKSFADLFDPGDPELERLGRKSNPSAEAPRPETIVELDLHGLTGPEAEIRIEAFIQRCHGAGVRRARIITGKGKHSRNGPVLKVWAEKKLRQMQKTGLTAAITWEGKGKKSGALLVRLK